MGERIVAVGPDLAPPEGARVVDAAGQWVVPGLIDAHVHLMNVPGETWLGLDPAGQDAMVRRQLRSYLACGVTTVLDAASIPAKMDRIRGWIRDGAPAPRVLVLGRPLGPADGYPAVMGPAFAGVASPAEVGPALDEAIAFGAVGAKVTFERGFGTDDWPLFTAEMRAAIREEASARSLPVFVHAMTPSEFVTGLEVGPVAFMHGPERAEPEVTEAIAEAGVYVVTTLTVYDSALVPLSEDRLADPLLRVAVPPELVTAALDRSTAALARRAIGELVVPWAPGWAAGLDPLARAIAGPKLRHAVEAVHDLHEAGVPVVAGTDSGTWPFLHGQFHGWAMIRELELLGDAGLDPAEVLAAATTTPARMLDRTDEIGTVEVGKAADLVVLGADPLTDRGAFRRVTLTVRAGVAHTPEEWMSR